MWVDDQLFRPCQFQLSTVVNPQHGIRLCTSAKCCGRLNRESAERGLSLICIHILTSCKPCYTKRVTDDFEVARNVRVWSRDQGNVILLYTINFISACTIGHEI